MVYIFEGLDGTGKTTLVQKLSEELKKRNIRHNVIKESVTHDEDEKKDRINRNALLRFRNKITIYDRATIIDDFVYKPVIDGEASLLNTLVSDTVCNGRTVVFYLEAPIDTLCERIGKRGDEYLDYDGLAEQLKTLSEQYEEVFEKLHIIPIRLNAELPTATLIEQIIPWFTYNNICQGLAHIVSQGNLKVLNGKRIVMSLAHLIQKSDTYAKAYAKLAESSTYVIMDNGAAEHSQVDMDTLYNSFVKVQPDEIILPDILHNRVETLKQFNKAIEYFCYKRNIGPGCSIMAVPQGSDFGEWKKCAEVMIQEPKVSVIGVTKFLVSTMNNYDARYIAVQYIDQLRKKYNRPDVVVHLLGWEERPMTIHNIFEDFPFVRSCDSCFGYLAAANQQHLYPTSERPKGEIDFLSNEELPWLKATLEELEIAVGVD